MKQRTLKEVAQAGLVLGFEWIAKDDDGDSHRSWLYRVHEPKYSEFETLWYNGGYCNSVSVEITDYPHAPEKSLLKLSEIVEGEA